MLTQTCPQVASEVDRALLAGLGRWGRGDLKAIFGVVSRQLGSPQEQPRLAALHWVHSLLRLRQSQVRCWGLNGGR